MKYFLYPGRRLIVIPFVIVCFTLKMNGQTCPFNHSPQNEWYCTNNTFSLGVSTETASTYSWYKDAVLIPGGGPYDGDGQPKSFSFAITEANHLATAGRYSVVQNQPGCPPAEILVKNIYWSTTPIDVVSTTDITPYAVSFSWTSTGAGAQYKYEVSTNSTPSGLGTTTTATTATVKSLLANTLYYIHVGPTCDFGFINDWTTISFTTLNATVACPLTNPTMSVSSSGSGYVYQWQIAAPGSNNFTNLTNTAPYSTVTTTTLHFTTPATSLYGNKYRCVATKPASSTVTSNPNVLIFAATWTGTGGTGWGTPTSWSCGNVPDANTDVIIPLVANKPVVTGTVNCRSISVSSGTITVSANARLNVTGPVQ